MWKIALIGFLCVGAGFASAGRLPRSEDNESNEKECSEGTECELTDVCGEGNCGCSTDEIFVHGACHKLATESQNECQFQEQCAGIPDSLCQDSKCVGQKGLGATCGITLECNIAFELVCDSGTCQCTPGSEMTTNGCQKILPEDINIMERNQTGNLTGPCHDENAEIVEEACLCKTGYVETNDGNACLKEAANLGDECENTKQCEAVNGTCTDGVCKEIVLSAAAVPMSDPVIISSECVQDDDCSTINHAICKESICECSENYISSPDQSKCLPLAAKAGDECETEKQCSKLPNLSCLEGKCVAVAAAGIHARKNGSPTPFSTSTPIAITVVILAWNSVA